MADPRPAQNAARLSEDIGDVLSAIRRMIADDEVLAAARDRSRTDRNGLVQDDAAEFLARRYGGNAALARQLVETGTRQAPAALPEPDRSGDHVIPQFRRRAEPAAAFVEPAPPPAEAVPAKEPTAEASGWRSWLRPAGREAGVKTEAVAAEPPALPVAAVDLGDDADDFAEAFDWKARLRPSAPAAAPEAPRLVLVDTPRSKPGETGTSEQRRSGWAVPPQEADPPQPVAPALQVSDPQAQQLLQDPDIRNLLREIVQNELNGELGVRFSANLRIVIRREVAAAIDAHLDHL